MHSFTLALASLLALASAGVAAAAPGAFSDAAAFAAAVPSGVSVFDFEALADGTPVSGSTLTPDGSAAGVILPTPIADVLDPSGPALSLRVVADALNNPATSGTRSLGVDDAKNFDAIAGGSSIEFGFTTPVEAFGLTVITPEEPGAALFDGDLVLTVAGEPTASLTIADAQLLGTFGGRDYRGYFLGIVGVSSFSNARLEAGGAAPVSGYFFNVDDLRVSVPEPGFVPQWVSGASLLFLAAARRRGRTS